MVWSTFHDLEFNNGVGNNCSIERFYSPSFRAARAFAIAEVARIKKAGRRWFDVVRVEDATPALAGGINTNYFRWHADFSATLYRPDQIDFDPED